MLISRPTYADFTHPGVLHTQADLDRIRTNILAGNQPWSGAYLAFKANSYSQSNYVAHPVAYANTNYPNHSYQIEYDSCGAYQNALMWYITSNQNYANEAISILNGWSSTMTNINPTADISAYIAGLKFSAAAEILRYEGSGWSETGILQCSNMLETILYPCLQNVLPGGDGNQGAGMIRGIMAIAIFCDNTNEYNEAVNAFEGNAMSTNLCVAMTHYIDTNGCPGEAGRDQAHPQGGIASYEEMAQMAWCQGLDLWDYATNLQNAFEWSAAENLGTNVPFSNKGTCYATYGSLSTIDQGEWTMMYEMAYNHFSIFEGHPMPYTQFVLTNRLRPEDGANDDPGFGTLLWSLNPSISPSEYGGTNKIIDANSGMAVETVNSGTSQGTQIDQNNYNGSSHQQWIFTPLGGNYYRIVNLNANNTNIVDSGANPSKSGVGIHLWGGSGNDNQIWQVVDDGSGHVRIYARDTVIMKFPITNLLWDVTGGSLAAGAVIEMAQTNSNNSQLFTISSPLTLPGPGNLTSISSNSSVQLNWAAVSGTLSYYLKRSLTNGGPYSIIANVINTNYSDGHLSNGVTYYYIVTATNANGESPNSAQVSGTPSAQAATPTGLTGIPGNQRAILAWNASINSTGYNVKRGTISGGPYPIIFTNTPASTFTDTTLVNGTTYYYVVSGTNAAGESPNSAQISVTPNDYSAVHTEGDLIVNLQAGDLNTSSPITIWTNRTLSSNSVGNFARNGGGSLSVMNLPFGATNVNGLYVNGNANNALISAQNIPVEIAGNGTISVEAWVYGLSFLNGQSAVTGYGSASIDDEDRQFLAFGINSGSTYKAFAGEFNDLAYAVTNIFTLNTWHMIDWIWNGSQLRVYVDDALNTNGSLAAMTTPQVLIGIGGTYHTSGIIEAFPGLIGAERVQSGLLTASDIASNYALGPMGSAAVLPPAGLTGSAGDGQAMLVWSPSYNASSYNVLYAMNSGGPYSLLTSNLIALNFTATGLSDGAQYYFVTSANGAAGESVNSSEVSVRPVSLSPVILGFLVASNQLQFNWPQDHTGWHLQAQTNSLASGLGANWTDVSGSSATNQFFATIISSNGSVFYRLIYP